MKRLAIVALSSAVILVAGCGSSKATTASSVPAVAVTAAASSSAPSSAAPAATSAAAAVTTAPAADTTALPASTAAPVTAPPPSPDLITISVTVGKDTSPTRVENIPYGKTVQISLLNPIADDEFHIHGIDIEQALKAGQQGLISFVADKGGSYELESHVTKGVLLTLVVKE